MGKVQTPLDVPVVLPANSPERRFRYVEYVVIGENIRFLSGSRFALLAFAATVHTALFGAFRALVSSPGTFGGLAPHALWALPTIGACVSAAILAIDWRNRRLYSACLDRGQDIEAELGLKGTGSFHQLGAVRDRARMLSHSRMLRAIHAGLIVLWAILWYYRESFVHFGAWT